MSKTDNKQIRISIPTKYYDELKRRAEMDFCSAPVKARQLLISKLHASMGNNISGGDA